MTSKIRGVYGKKRTDTGTRQYKVTSGKRCYHNPLSIKMRADAALYEGTDGSSRYCGSVN
ncbi:MAG: hypothetical protein AMK71_01745 [Nitrospira bacterium SG8_35_4]|nr:MAG: hypothetical protein AMK71_01745 [Nitrospira bacterium SG8_35_4]